MLRLLAQDWRLKLFSLGVALVLFIFVSVENATPVGVEFNIEYRLSDELMITNNPPATLHTTLQGPWAAFRSYEAKELEPVVVDLGRAEPGPLRHVVELRAITPPGGMRVVAVDPSDLEVVLDRRVERQVPIHPDIPDAPAFGFEILDVRIAPARARVVGPAAKMQALDFIATRTIDVVGREDDLSLEVELRPPPPPLRLLDKRVQVFVEVGEEFVQRTLTNVPVRLEGPARPLQAQPSQVTLNLRGPRKVVEALDRDHLEAVVDLSVLPADGSLSFERSVKVRPELPERTQLVAPIPKVEFQLAAPRRSRRKQ